MLDIGRLLLVGLLIGLLLISASVEARSPVSLADACGFDRPVTEVEVITTRDGGSYTITNPALVAHLNDATGLLAPNIKGVWVETIRIQPGNAVAEVYFYGGVSRPYRLHCEATGNIVRTNDAFFDCHLLGVCF